MHVLISGAGIAGPTLAWFLARTGARIDIIEKTSSILPHGQNVDVEGGAISALKKMGLLEEVRRLTTTEKGTQFINPEGKPYAFFPQNGNSISPTSEFEILRGDLAALFYGATKNHPNINYRLGTTIKNVISNDERAVKVEFSNGEVKEFDLLIAADGQWSRTRRQCFLPETVKVVDKGSYAAYFTIPRLSGDNDWWNIYQCLDSRILSIRPDGHGTTRALLSRMPCNEAQKKAWQEACTSDRQTQEDLLRKEFADAGWQAQRLLAAMEEAPDFYFQAIQQIRMSKWSTSRVVCVGDAAYAPTPLTGMGTSLGIMGAYVLAGELSKLNDGEHPERAFEGYESTFRPFVEKIQDLPSFVPGIVHPRTAWKRWLFQCAVWMASKLVTLRISFTNTSGEANDDEFPLPEYPTLGLESCEKGVGSS
jgi:2-polyprenyl-6-methoxyphenol hydroxylase-like FAD-dependent oxidoreductase